MSDSTPEAVRADSLRDVERLARAFDRIMELMSSGRIDPAHVNAMLSQAERMIDVARRHAAERSAA